MVGSLAAGGGEQDSEGEHGQENESVPGVPAAALVVVETDLGLRGLESLLIRPPAAQVPATKPEDRTSLAEYMPKFDAGFPGEIEHVQAHDKTARPYPSEEGRVLESF
jgi:hypothetical protein